MAGLCYIILIVIGGYGHLSTANISAATIAEHETVWRQGAIALLAMLAADVSLAVLLLILLKPAGPALAYSAFAFRLVVVGVLSVAVTARLTALQPATQVGDVEAIRAALVSFSKTGFDVAFVFFGFVCLCLGALILQSRLVPVVFGSLFLLAGIAYLADTLARLLNFSLALPFDLLTAAYVVEFSFALWLIIFSVRPSTRAVT